MTAQIDKLIGRVLDGKASLEEIRALADWVRADERNRTYFRQCKKIWHLTHKRLLASGQQEEALQCFRGYMRRERLFVRRRRLVRVVSAIAGMAAVVAVFFFTGLLERGEGATALPVAQVDGVQLVLPDGSRHELMEGQTVQDIVEASGFGKPAFDSAARLVPDVTAESVVKYNEVIVPHGTGYTFSLPDGSSVILNAGSRLRFPVSFAEGERKVFLNGEAYFDVVRDEEHPFLVEFPEGTVRVLGTEFNVNAYQGHPASAVLVSGKVEVVAGEEKAVLQPGQRCEVQPDGLAVSEADLMTELAWKNGEFVFKGASWKQVMDELARWYDADIRYNESEMSELKLHIYMKRTATLPEALEVISGIVDISYSVEGRKVLIKRR